VLKTGGAEPAWFGQNIDDLMAGAEAELKTLQAPSGAAKAAPGGAAKAADAGTKAVKPKGLSDEQILAEARRAIAGGKDPAGVKARLKEWGLELK